MHRGSTSFFLKTKMYILSPDIFIVIDVGKGNTYSCYHFPRRTFFQAILTTFCSQTLNDSKVFYHQLEKKFHFSHLSSSPDICN